MGWLGRALLGFHGLRRQVGLVGCALWVWKSMWRHTYTACRLEGWGSAAWGHTPCPGGELGERAGCRNTPRSEHVRFYVCSPAPRLRSKNGGFGFLRNTFGFTFIHLPHACTAQIGCSVFSRTRSVLCLFTCATPAQRKWGVRFSLVHVRFYVCSPAPRLRSENGAFGFLRNTFGFRFIRLYHACHVFGRRPVCAFKILKGGRAGQESPPSSHPTLYRVPVRQRGHIVLNWVPRV